MNQSKHIYRFQQYTEKNDTMEDSSLNQTIYKQVLFKNFLAFLTLSPYDVIFRKSKTDAWTQTNQNIKIKT